MTLSTRRDDISREHSLRRGAQTAAQTEGQTLLLEVTEATIEEDAAEEGTAKKTTAKGTRAKG